MQERQFAKGKIGVLVAGHREYWNQFPGSREQLLKNADNFEAVVTRLGGEVVTYTAADGTQMCDTTEESYKAGVYFKAQDVDILILYLTTYVASGRYMQGVLACDAPVVVVGYQAPSDFSKRCMSEDIFWGSVCPVPEACNALTRCKKPPVGVLIGEYFKEARYDERFEEEIRQWCVAARALRGYKGAIFGHMGHSYEGMLDMNFDPTGFTANFGVHIRMVELCNLAAYVDQTPDAEIREKLAEINEKFTLLGASHDSTTRETRQEDLDWAARCSVALDKLVQEKNLSGMAYYYEGQDQNLYERVAAGLIIGNSLLVSKGYALAGESDMRTCLAMYTTSALGGGGSFAELVAVDFENDLVLIGHDGPHDIRISDAKPTIRALELFHGKKGNGVSVEFSLKAGPITMLGLGVDENNQYTFIVAEGESRKGAVPQQGNTLTRGYFGKDVQGFLEDWSRAGNNHHYALSVGHHAAELEKLAKALGIGFRRIR